MVSAEEDITIDNTYESTIYGSGTTNDISCLLGETEYSNTCQNFGSVISGLSVSVGSVWTGEDDTTEDSSASTCVASGSATASGSMTMSSASASALRLYK